MKIIRNGKTVFEDSIKIKRKLEDLVTYLYKECSFENGSFLMTGTGIVPTTSFTLQSADEIQISIDKIGTLINFVK
jgi:2-dehydro-3-deoxy-D-arabinonate dehydratase